MTLVFENALGLDVRGSVEVNYNIEFSPNMDKLIFNNDLHQEYDLGKRDITYNEDFTVTGNRKISFEAKGKGGHNYQIVLNEGLDGQKRFDLYKRFGRIWVCL